MYSLLCGTCCPDASQQLIDVATKWKYYNAPFAYSESAVSEPVWTSVWRLWRLLFTKRQRSGDGTVNVDLYLWQMTTVKCSLEAISRRLDGGWDRSLGSTVQLPPGVVVALGWSVDRRCRCLVAWHVTSLHIADRTTTALYHQTFSSPTV